MLTNWQNRVLSSIIAILRDFLSTSSSSAFCWFTDANDESIRLCKLSDVPFFAFFCRRNVSLERFFSSLRQRLYSLVCSLSRITTWRFHSSNLSCKLSIKSYENILDKKFLSHTCIGIIRLSIMAVVKVFNRVSTALCRRQTRVRAVPISFDAPASGRRRRIKLII